MWKTHFNLKYKFEEDEDEDPVNRTVELGSYVVSALGELETYRWSTTCASCRLKHHQVCKIYKCLIMKIVEKKDKNN